MSAMKFFNQMNRWRITCQMLIHFPSMSVHCVRKNSLINGIWKDMHLLYIRTNLTGWNPVKIHYISNPIKILKSLNHSAMMVILMNQLSKNLEQTKQWWHVTSAKRCTATNGTLGDTLSPSTQTPILKRFLVSCVTQHLLQNGTSTGTWMRNTLQLKNFNAPNAHRNSLLKGFWKVT